MEGFVKAQTIPERERERRVIVSVG